MKVSLVILLSLIVIVVSGQDTIVELSQVQISASRLNTFTTGLKTLSIDSLTLETSKFDNLDEILGRETPLYIKSYGQGGLATIAFRGTAATHTGFTGMASSLILPISGSLICRLRREPILTLFRFYQVVRVHFSAAETLGAAST